MPSAAKMRKGGAAGPEFKPENLGLLASRKGIHLVHWQDFLSPLKEWIVSFTRARAKKDIRSPPQTFDKVKQLRFGSQEVLCNVSSCDLAPSSPGP